jgi:hypothetical protein
MMLKLTEEFLILKLLTKMYSEALNAKDPTQMLELVVDIAESAEKLEQMTCDYINGYKA